MKRKPAKQCGIIPPRFLEMTPGAQRKIIDMQIGVEDCLKHQLLEAFRAGYVEGWDARWNKHHRTNPP